VLLGLGDLECSAARVASSDGVDVVARGSVSGVLQRDAGLARGEIPTRFASDSATVSREGSTLTLEGNARVWQGDRVLRADHITYDREDT